jgi:hypothetical protein
VITILKFTVHEYRSADSMPAPLSLHNKPKSKSEREEEDDDDGRDVDLIVREWTDPSDGEYGVNGSL